MKSLLALVLLLPLLAGCMNGGSGSATIERRELARLVLQPDDLPPAYERFDEGRQVRADQPQAGERAEPRRFGRRDGWKARYRRSGSPETRGPLVIESRVDLFPEAEGAERELDAYRREIELGSAQQSETSEVLDDPALGDEAFAVTLLQPGSERDVRFYLVAWRAKNVTAAVFVNGFDARLTLGDTLELARAQQQRIERAASE